MELSLRRGNGIQRRKVPGLPPEFQKKSCGIFADKNFYILIGISGWDRAEKMMSFPCLIAARHNGDDAGKGRKLTDAQIQRCVAGVISLIAAESDAKNEGQAEFAGKINEVLDCCHKIRFLENGYVSGEKIEIFQMLLGFLESDNGNGGFRCGARKIRNRIGCSGSCSGHERSVPVRVGGRDNRKR